MGIQELQRDAMCLVALGKENMHVRGGGDRAYCAGLLTWPFTGAYPQGQCGSRLAKSKVCYWLLGKQRSRDFSQPYNCGTVISKGRKESLCM